MSTLEKAGNEREQHDARQISKEAELRIEKSNELLRAREQELIAINEQLSASMQQLQANEQSLRQSEERFRDLAENISAVFWLCSPDWQQIFYVSPAYEKVWGRTCQSLYERPMSWLDAVAGDDREMVLAELQKRIERTSTDAMFPEYRIVMPDNTVRWILARIYPVLNEQGAIVRMAGIAEDITDRRNAEESLSNSEQRYRALFEFMSNAVAIYKAVDNGEDFIFVDFNAAAERIENVRRQDVIGKSVLQAFPGVREFGLFEVFQRVWRTGQPEQFPIAFYQDQRIAGWRDNFLYKLPSGEVVAVYSDETARRQAEDSLESSLHLMQALIDAVPTPVFYKDTEGRYLGCNRAFEEFFGRPRDQIIGQTVYAAGPREVADVYRQKDDELFRDGGSQVYEYKIVQPDNTLREVIFNKATFSLSDGRTAGIVGAIFDITERKRAEAELRRLAAAVEQAQEIVTICDPDGIVQYINPAVTRVLGYAPEELVGKRPLFHEEEGAVAQAYAQAWHELSQGKPWCGHAEERRKDGSECFIEMSVSPVTDHSGQVTDYVVIARDITRERDIEERLRQAEKMEAIGTLAGGIAHDFNNIVAGVMGYAEVAQQVSSRSSPVWHYLDEILTLSTRASSLVQQILTFSRKSREERKPLLLSSIIREAIKLIRSTVPANIEVRQHIEDAGCVVQADITQIHQVVMNLCTNAAHAMRACGGVLDIALSTAVLTEADAHSRTDMTPGRYVQLTVSDTGMGIDPGNMPRIFEPFFTTKGEGEGTGMGLAVVHGIVKSYGGDITVHSQPGQGTTFTILLPQAVVAGKQAREEQQPSKLPTGHERILLVDDEVSIVESGQKTLEALGYAVTGISSSAQALEAFQHDPGGFDLVITDQTMPQMTGYELAQKILALRPDIPVIMCTGYSDSVSDEQAKSAGIRDFMIKPLNREKIARAIRRVLDAG